MKIDPKVDEAVETLNMKDGPTRRRLLSGAGLVSASAAAAALLGRLLVERPGLAAATGAAGNFPKTPAWQFWYVNHVTTNPFFVPTQYGFQDAAALLDLPTPKWGGSQNSLTSEMVSYFNTAISAKAAGIAVRGHRRHLVHHPGEERDERGHPGAQLQRRRPGQEGRPGHRHQPAGVRRPGAVHLRPAAGQQDQVS